MNAVPFWIGSITSRLRFCWVYAVAAALMACQAAATSPNVLLIMTDDQGYGDLSIHGNPYLQTPHLDSLARSSVRFDRFYVNSFCAPTRAALLTGRHSLRTGCHGVTHHREAMKLSEVTIAAALGDAGYRSTCIGKWHNGEQYPYTPQGKGFDESFGFNNGHWNTYFDAPLLRGSRFEATHGYITDVLTDEAIRFISATKRAEPTQPFFCYLSYNAPHSPFQVPDHYFDKYKAMELADKVSAYFGMCENIDDNVGRLLEFLRREALLDDTIVMFLSDNGGTAGVSTYNAGMRGNKTSVHEGGCRVPFFCRWSAAGWSAREVPELASHIDILPTLLDLCGVSDFAGPELDGISLRPLLEQQDLSAWPPRTIFTHNPIDETNRYPGAVRTNQYRLLREIPGPQGGSSAENRDDDATPWQLYDMLADPGQAIDIADQHPDIVAQLSAAYEAWFDDVSGEGLQRFPLPVGYPQQNPVRLQAPQAFFDPPLQFANGPGFANDWLTNWRSIGATVWFDLDVATAGTYAVVLRLGIDPADAGAKLEIAVGEQVVSTILPTAAAPEIPLPDRDPRSRARFRNRDWQSLPVGTLDLPAGRTRLALVARTLPGDQVMDLKEVELSLRQIGDAAD